LLEASVASRDHIPTCANSSQLITGTAQCRNLPALQTRRCFRARSRVATRSKSLSFDNPTPSKFFRRTRILIRYRCFSSTLPTVLLFSFAAVECRFTNPVIGAIPCSAVAYGVCVWLNNSLFLRVFAPRDFFREIRTSQYPRFARSFVSSRVERMISGGERREFLVKNTLIFFDETPSVLKANVMVPRGIGE